MFNLDDIMQRCRATPGKRFRIEDHDPGWEGDRDIPKGQRKKHADQILSEGVSALADAQERLYASDTWSVLVVFQALDAAGKDGTIKHVMSGVNPQGCQVYSFKQPTSEELDHDFLWRCAKVLPERGRIGIFNRSYYEEVLVVRVHPELLAAQRLPHARAGAALWRDRFRDINNFERHLTDNGTLVLKFFLNVSREEQRQRFLDRIHDPQKHWKFSARDVAERAYWDDYQRAYSEAIRHTSTEWAPWYVIPADDKWITRALVARILSASIEKLELAYPRVDGDRLKEILDAERQLENE